MKNPENEMFKIFKRRKNFFSKYKLIEYVSVNNILLSIDSKINFEDFRLKYIELGLYSVKEDYVSSMYFTCFDKNDPFLHISEASTKRDIERCSWRYVDTYLSINYALALFEHIGYADNDIVKSLIEKIPSGDRITVESKIPYGMRVGTPFSTYRPVKLKNGSEDVWLGRNCPKRWYSSWEDKSHYISYKYKFKKDEKQ